MKMNQKMNIAMLAVSVSLMSMSAAVTADIVPDRLVVTYAVPTGYVYAQSARVARNVHCLSLPSGDAWCVPAPAGGQINAQRRATPGSTTLRSEAVVVPAELSPEYARALLENTGLYQSVENDVLIKNQSTNQSTWNTVTPNDPHFEYQSIMFNDNSEAFPVASSILSMWRLLKNPTKNVDVYVLDSEFRLHDDIDYAAGYNFALPEQRDDRPEVYGRGPGFIEDDFWPKEGGYCVHGSHGLEVAGVIGAKINNGHSTTGVTGDATINPLRVMSCGEGYMSDAAAALAWLSGESLTDLPDFTGKPGIVNMSLGGKNPNCPNYLQNAINAATAKGFTIVVAAGNDGYDASRNIPGNCENVITVGATNVGPSEWPHPQADLADFSNYGEPVDIMAWGDFVATPSISSGANGVGFGSGTSAAAPIVAGIIANLAKDFPFTPQQWGMLVNLSGKAHWAENSRCVALGCGAGVLDAVKLYRNAVRLQNGELDSATYSLNAVPACRQAWMVENLSAGKSLCNQVTITADSFANLGQNETIHIHALSNGQTVADGSGLVGVYDTSHVVIDKSELDGKTVYAQTCDANGVCGIPAPINTTGLADIPAVCQE